MRWSIDQRLAFIETRLYWEGQLNRKDLKEFFNISTPQASADLKRYSEAAPRNMYYDPSEKVYKATPEFEPHFISTEPEEYFFQLKLSQGEGFNRRLFLGFSPEFYSLPSPQRRMNPAILKRVLKIMREKKALEIQYQSMTDPETHWRWITPYAFGFDGFRWHVRSYCHKRKKFRDFVLGRILDTGEERPHEINPADDTEWNSEVILKIAPHPDLSGKQQQIIEYEYGMENGILELPVKAAFVIYAMRRFEFGRELAGDTAAAVFPEKPRIILLNKEEILSRLKEFEAP